jgi:Uncharacterized protein conserved in bacteria
MYSIADRVRSNIVGLAAVGALTALSGTMANAQVYDRLLDSEIPLSTRTGRNQGVTERPHPELQAQGLPVGSFRLYPEVTAGAGFTSNVIGQEDGNEADGYVMLRPEVELRSQWSSHSLRANAYYEGRRFFDTTAKNRNAYLVSVEGQYDTSRDGYALFRAAARRNYEDQTSGNFPDNGAGAVAIDVLSALARVRHQFNRVILTGNADYSDFNFQPTVTTTDRRLDLDYRDHAVGRATVRAEYELSPDNAVFTQFTYQNVRYDQRGVTTDRGGDEWRLGVGAIADVTSLLRLAGAVGYFRRSYDNGLLRPISSFNVDLQATYYLSPLTTASAIITRQLEEAAVTGSSGYISNRASVRVDHELLRNLRPYAYAGYDKSDFKGIDRTDNRINTGLGAVYDANRNFSFSGEVSYIARDSDGVNRGPRINEFRTMITTRAKL